jgi:hypothetical protein
MVIRQLIYRVDERVNLVVILLLFWALFWGLNGGDKFLNGRSAPNVASWSASSVLVDAGGSIAYRLHPIEPTGWYGVNRNNKMIGYFARLSLPRDVALACLYGFAVLEMILGAMFLAVSLWSMLPEGRQSTVPLFSDRTVQRLAFKGSILVFLCFSVGDILFGDRAELWEHGTFIVLCLITYDMWYRTDRFLIEQRRELAARTSRSIQAATYSEEDEGTVE